MAAAASSSSLLPPSSLHCRPHHHHNRPFIKLNQFRSEFGRNQLTHKRNKGLIGRASTLEEFSAFDPLASIQGPDPELVAALKLKLLVSFLNVSSAEILGWHAMCLYKCPCENYGRFQEFQLFNGAY